MSVKSYIEFLFNIKNNSIYTSERIEEGFCFVSNTSLEVLDTQLQPATETREQRTQRGRTDTTASRRREVCKPRRRPAHGQRYNDLSRFRIHIINYNT